MGLGSCSKIPLKEAWFKTSACCDLLDQGIDPICRKQKENLRRAGVVFLYEKLPPVRFKQKNELKNEGKAARWLIPLE
ncbi:MULTISPECIES: hypothetical protein [unclassified Bartonella]|uniref:hypothetical protein n=1 Tax=unclassified Bartonella TaxID=2645622 RepID=UPI0035CEC5BE